MLQLVFAQTELFLKQTQEQSDRPNINEREDLVTSGNAHSSFLACNARCATSSDYLPGRKPTKANAQVIAEDMLVAAIKASAAGNRVCVLCVGNARRAGGAVRYGARAQEEELYRRTDMFTRAGGLNRRRVYRIDNRPGIQSDIVVCYYKDVKILRG